MVLEENRPTACHYLDDPMTAGEQGTFALLEPPDLRKESKGPLLSPGDHLRAASVVPRCSSRHGPTEESCTGPV